MYSRISHGRRGSIEGTSFADNPLLAARDLTNVQIVGDRAVIPLLPRWPVLFRGLRTFGRVVYFCRNRGAALGRLGAYPAIWTTPCGRNASDGDRSLKFFFPAWASAFVTVEQQEADWLYGVEFLDFHGDMIHRVFLTSGSDLDAFRWWIDINQASNPRAGLGLEVRSPARGRDPTFRARPLGHLSWDNFRRLLRAMIETEACVRISVANQGLVQSVSIRPSRLREDRSTIYFGDEAVGLQLRVNQLAEISLYRSTRFSEWRLQVYELEGFPACAIELERGEASRQLDFLFTEGERSRTEPDE